MRVRCTDDEDDDIMDSVADLLPDRRPVNQPTENMTCSEEEREARRG
jgi:hypothetical protein